MDKKTRCRLERLRGLVVYGAEKVKEKTKQFSDEERLDFLFSHAKDLRIIQCELDRILNSDARDAEAQNSNPDLGFSDDELGDLSGALSMEIVAVLDPIRQADWVPNGDVNQRLKRANQLQALKDRIDAARGDGA